MFDIEGVKAETKKKIPSINDILDRAWAKLKPNCKDVERRFGYWLLMLDREANEIFHRFEFEALKHFSIRWLEAQEETLRKRLKKILEKDFNSFLDEASKIFAQFGIAVQSLEKDLGNMRKARGGRNFELTVARLLDFIGISNEIPSRRADREKLRRIDIVVPNIEMAIHTPDKCFFITCKRTLRERWKQEIPQVQVGQRVYLISLDSSISAGKALEMKKLGLITFLPTETVDDLINNTRDLTVKKELSDVLRDLDSLPHFLR